MDLVQMRASFRRRAAGLADALDDVDVDRYMNHAFQHTVPDAVDGQLYEDVWTQLLSAGIPEYPFPNWVHSVRPSIYIDRYWLDLHDRLNDFQLRYIDYQNTQGRPTAVLSYERALRFYPVPDAEYEVQITVRAYPSDPVVGGTTGQRTLKSLPASGIEYYTHANAVIWSGLVEFAEDYDLPEIEARAEVKGERARADLQARERTRHRRRRPRRTF